MRPRMGAIALCSKQDHDGSAMRTHFLQLAAYNTWANARLYQAAGSLGEAALNRPLDGAYFGSLLGTLNHMLVADRLWLARLEGEAKPHDRLDERPYGEFAALRQARVEHDARLPAFIDALTVAEIEADLDYQDMGGTPRRLPRRIILTHIINHATHHRGQAHHQLKQLGLNEPPALDLPYFVLDLA
jgi:uncharacterized damage-inducible protein DinB